MNEQIFLSGAPVVGFGSPEADALAHERATAPGTIAGFVIGAIGGAILGNVIHKGAVGATVGTIAGGVGGGLGGNLIASYVLRKPPQKDCESLSADERTTAFNKAKTNLEAAGTPFDASWMSDPTKFGAFMAEVAKVAGCSVTPPASAWRRVPFPDLAKLKSGQQVALAAAAASGAPIPPEDIAAVNLQVTALATAPVNLPTKNYVQYPPGSKLPPDWPADDDLGPNAYRITVDMIADAPLEAMALQDPSSSVGTIKVWVRDKLGSPPPPSPGPPPSLPGTP